MLKTEIEEIEKFNYYYQIIHHNFRKYKNISFDDFKYITFNSNSTQLNNLIVSHNLKFENDINETIYDVYIVRKVDLLLPQRIVQSGMDCSIQ